MSENPENRQCPLCQQIVSSEIKGLSVLILPSRRVLLCPGCAGKVVAAFKGEYFEGLRNED